MHSKRPLLWTLPKAFGVQLAAVLLSRLCLSALQLCQPLLINQVTTWLGNNDHKDQDTGHGLIGATICIYIGLAIANVTFKREMDRLNTKARGALNTAIHAKMLRLSSQQLSDSSCLTLMTADIARVSQSLERLDYFVAAPFELAVAIYLLNTQIGVSCIAPVASGLVISLLSFVDSNRGLPVQKRWLQAVQERISYTALVLGSPKAMKMLGLTEYLGGKIQGLRLHEVEVCADYRKFSTRRNTFASLPQSFSPAFTLMMFTLVEGFGALTPTVAFTTLALVQLVTNPIHEIIFAVPGFQMMLASLDRMQGFLNDEELLAAPNASHPVASTEGSSPIELSVLTPAVSKAPRTPTAILLDSVSVCIGHEGKMILRCVNVNIAPTTLTMVVGPVGSGKSMLLKAIIGEVVLSGGQVRYADEDFQNFGYCTQDAWLPNDTVRGLIIGQTIMDVAWYERIVDACALHADFTSFPEFDRTVIGTRGISLSGGQRQRLALARALYARKSALVVDDALSGLDASTSRQVFDNVFGPRGVCKQLNTTVIFATHSVQYLRYADHIVALAEDGSVAEQGTFSELESRDGYVHHMKIKAVSFDERQEGQPALLPIKALEKANDAQHDLARRTGDVAIYRYYLRTLGMACCLGIVASDVLFTFGVKFPDVFVRLWSESALQTRPEYPLGFWIGIMFLLGCISAASVFANIWTMLVWSVPKSSAKIHERVLQTVLRAPYSFFVDTDSGAILNRFSNDMALIDSELAGAFMQTLHAFSTFIAGAVLIATGARYVGVAMPAIVFVLYWVQKVYLRTSRQLRFMELEAQAPLLAHVSETMAGVTTIRAFGWQHNSHQRCLELLDGAQRPFYLMLCVQRWLNLVLDLVTAALATIVVALAVTMKGTSSAGSIGVSLLNILSFNTNLSFLIVAWTTLETSLGAVARCKNFETKTPAEDNANEDEVPPIDWPANGEMRFRGVSAAYKVDGEDVLKDINFDVREGEKIGICGRSGSGKSSLLMTLLRLLDYRNGSITLDGVDLAGVPRQTIRSRVTALPQEAIVLPGSLRQNLDPRESSSQPQLRQALDKVGLLDIIEQRGGLDMTMADLSLSQGQLQLFAVARACLHKSKLLVLDEMTSSVDAVSEELMMKIILEEFQQSSIVAVAHRLQTIRDFDRVVVMDNGAIVETGAPRELLEREGGWFRAMWEGSGH